MIIETGMRVNSAPPAFKKISAAHSDFFDGFQTIGNESRADDEQL
jgi:hypothetical protein